MLGWCIGGTLAAMYAALEHDAVRNLILLTTPDRHRDLALRQLGLLATASTRPP